MEKTIKEIYGCFPCVLSTSPSPLEVWYNTLLEKKPSEITISDVLRMLRQKVLVDFAIRKSVDYLNKDPFCGYFYDGELLQQLYDIETSEIYPYTSDIVAILKTASLQLQCRVWMTSGDSSEIQELIVAFVEKLSTF